MSFSIQSGDQRYEETEQQIRRIGRQKVADDKIVAVHREKTLEHGPNREKAGDEGQKKRLEDQHGSRDKITRGKVW